MTSRRSLKWTDVRKVAYVSDWNANLPSDALREKYGIGSPASIAQWLRGQGYKLVSRGRESRGSN